MPRYRTQMGTLSTIGKGDATMWSGRFHVYVTPVNGKGKPVGKKKCVTLGLVSSMTRAQAQQKLLDVIQEHNVKNSRLTMLAATADHSGSEATIPHYHRGAVGELLVAADLMRRGLEVFRNMNPTGSTDLVTMRTGSLPMRVEVKFMSSGAMARHLRGRLNFDLLAIICESGNIRYYDTEGRSILQFQHECGKEGRCENEAVG